MSQKHANLMILISALLFSLGGLCFKLTTWNAFAINGVRCLFSCSMIFLYLHFVEKRKLVLSRGTLLGALCTFCMTTLYSFANSLTTAANAILIQYIAPVFVILLSWIFFRERPRRMDVITSVLVFGGIFCFVLDGLGSGNLLGDGLALLSGLSFAGVLLMNRMPGGDPFSATILGHFVAGLVGAPFVLRETDFSLQPVLAVVVLGIFQLGLGYIFFCRGIRHTAPVSAALISGVEPIANPVLVAIFVGEIITPLAGLGGAVVLLSVTGYNVLQGKRQKAEALAAAAQEEALS